MSECKWLKDQWVKQMTDSLSIRHPELSEKKIRSFVVRQYEKRYRDHDAQIFNSYENIVYNTTLGKCVDWIQSFQPLIAESGVFFYPKSMKRNLNVEIIKESMLDARTKHKAEMFAAMEAGDSLTARTKDLQQFNDKKAANSGYGAEGQPSSFLYNMHSAMSVTASGRGQLSTAIQTIENFIADNVKFFSMTEFYTYLVHIKNESKEWKYDAMRVVESVPTEEMWVERFRSKFLHPTICDEESVRKVYRGLSDELRVRMYYKCRLTDFLHNMNPKLKIVRLLQTKVVFNKKQKINEFVDPNTVPDSWKKPLAELSSLVLEFVGYRYGQFRYIDRSRYQKRACIPVSDTDSCMIMMHNVVMELKDHILPKRLERIGSDRGKYYHLALLGIVSCLTSDLIEQTLYHYLDKIHVPDEEKKHIRMKNEYHYSVMIITYAMKSYIGMLMRKESHVYDKPKLDVKGVNFFKSTASKKTSEFIYDEILMKRLLAPKDGVISLQDIYREISKFQKNIAKDIANGDMGFLKRSIKVKSVDAYANPMRVSACKAALVWNHLVGPEGEQIELPATTTQVKVLLRDKRDAAKLEPWPDIYRRTIELFDTDPEVGDYVTVDKNGNQKLIKGKGIKSIALPDTMDKVPDWVLAIIDVNTLVNDNMALFGQIYAPLGLSPGTATHNKSSMKFYTNVVRI